MGPAYDNLSGRVLSTGDRKICSQHRDATNSGIDPMNNRRGISDLMTKDDAIPTQDNDTDFAQDDTLGGRISLARDATQLTMAQAARRLGVQTATWKAWECDRDVPRSNRLAMMAGVLGVGPLWLLAGVGSGPVRRAAHDVVDLLRELRLVSEGAISSHHRVQELLHELEHRNETSSDEIQQLTDTDVGLKAADRV